MRRRHIASTQTRSVWLVGNVSVNVLGREADHLNQTHNHREWVNLDAGQSESMSFTYNRGRLVAFISSLRCENVGTDQRSVFFWVPNNIIKFVTGICQLQWPIIR